MALSRELYPFNVLAFSRVLWLFVGVSYNLRENGDLYDLV